jgi:hypothetical protein
MNRLSLLFLLYLILVGSANAAMLKPNDVLFDVSAASNYLIDTSNDENDLKTLSNPTQISEFNPETDSVPPTSWIVGLGLCLVFLGYKMKKNAG